MKYLPLHIAYFFMGWVAFFFLITRRYERKAIFIYFKKRHHQGWCRATWNTWRNHLLLGEVVVDRFAVYAGKKFHLEFDGYENFAKLEQGDSGWVQLSAHVGNYEIAGYTLNSKKKRINALIYSGETETVMENRNRVLSANNIRLVQSSPDLSHVFILNNALANGEIISMPVDRLFGSQKHIECELLDKTASFPLGAFTLAVQRDVPMLAVFSMKEKYNTYKVYCIPIALSEEEKNTQSKKRQVEILCKRYVKELENIILEYPLQWYNVFDFWNDGI